MKSMNLKPVYGYGWEERGASIGTPEPFNVRVLYDQLASDSTHCSKVFGEISTPHKYGGKWVFLSVRTLAKPETYNVKVYENCPMTSPESWDELDEVNTLATGFAVLNDA